MAEKIKDGSTVMWCRDCLAYVEWIHKCKRVIPLLP